MMMAEGAQPAEILVATLDVTLAGRQRRLNLSVPTAPVRAIDLLPLLQSFTDTLVAIAVETAESTGARVSCRKGCGACCRQLVPIAQVEVEAIRRVVQQLPEPRRSVVITRFEAACGRLGEAGLLEALRAPEKLAREKLLPLGVAYFAQGIPCPFLEDESCSIHADRPLSCREYLVTSPAENCAEPTPATIHCVKMPAKVSNAMPHIDPPEVRAAASSSWVPLILAMEWPVAKPAASALHAGTSRMASLLSQLFGKDIPQPDTSVALPDTSH
ncbi:MAG: YkgJ family cysteine cluster protein [Betaproteobacteria bacterium]